MGRAESRSVAIAGQRQAAGRTEVLLPVVAWCAWGMEAEPTEPDVTFVEPALRRRLSPVARSALCTAEQIRPRDMPVRVVFASRHGELKRNADMLQDLAEGEAPSPMNFSLSVLNAVAGLYAIARRDLSATSAVSAGRATVPLALLEGAVQAWTHAGEAVLVVCADEPPPPLYADLVDDPARPYALAVLMNAGTAARPVKCSWSRDGGATPRSSAVEAVVECLDGARAAEWQCDARAWRWEPHVPAGH